MTGRQRTLCLGVSEVHISIEVSLTPCSPDVDTSWWRKSPRPIIRVGRGLKTLKVEGELRNLNIERSNVEGNAALHINS